MDEATAERLLTGRLDPADATPGLTRLAALLAAAAGPPSPEELAGERAALARFAAVMRAAVGRLGTAKAGLCQAWRAGRGAEGGVRPDSPAFRALAVAAGGADKVAAYCQDATAGGTTRGGPDVMAAARAGLCQAWSGGQAGDDGRREDSVAFQVLAAAAGGADKVAGFCEATSASSTAANRQQPNAPPTSITPPSTTVADASGGPPVSTGPGGHAQGGPPTTTR